MKKAILAWSSGKDSALALDRIIRAEKYEVDSLLCVIVEEENRVGMHNVPFQYHSFVYDGPPFNNRIGFCTAGSTIREQRFHQLSIRAKNL